MNLKERLNTWYKQLISLKGEPNAIAAGLAIGVFIGVTPTIPFHTILIVLICFLFKKNITAGYLGTWIVSNPLTIPSFYFTEYWLGSLLVGNGSKGLEFFNQPMFGIMQMGRDILIPLLTGGFILAPLFTVPAYFITYRLIVSVREKRHDHSEKNP